MSTHPSSPATELFTVPKQIVVATDLTDCDLLLPHVVAQSEATGAHVTLVHAILPANLLSMETGTFPYPEQERLDRSITGMVIDAGARLRARGVSCDVVAEHGFASDVLRRQVEATGATRLIMATHGRGRLGRMALGSVAAELLRSMEIPVFAIGPHADAGEEKHAVPRRIVCAVSFSRDCAARLAFAFEVARSYGAELTLLHVLEEELSDGSNLSWRMEQARQALIELLPDRTLQPGVTISVATGERIERILDCADGSAADWLMVGVGPTVPFWPFQERLAYQLMARSAYPVLTCGAVLRAGCQELGRSEPTAATPA